MYKAVNFVALCLCSYVLVDVGLAFLLFTSLNMIITNTKEDHFIIRGLPNIDLQIFLVCGISIHRKYWGKLEARQHCLLLFDLSLALFIISTKVKTNNTWLKIQIILEQSKC